MLTRRKPGDEAPPGGAYAGALPGRPALWASSCPSGNGGLMRHSTSHLRGLLVRLHGSYQMRVTTSRIENPQGFVWVEMFWGLYNLFQWFEVSITTNVEKHTNVLSKLPRQICQVFRKTTVSCSVALWELLQGSEFQTWKRLLFYRVFPQLHDTVVQVGCRSVLAEALQGSWACKYMIGLIVDPSKNLHGKKGEFKPNISPRTQINAMWVWLRFCSSDIRHQTIVRALAALAAIFANVQPEEARRIETLECLKAPSEPKNA